MCLSTFFKTFKNDFQILAYVHNSCNINTHTVIQQYIYILEQIFIIEMEEF